MDKQELIDLFEDQNDPNLLPEELKYVWAWLAMKGSAIADQLAADYDHIDHEELLRQVERMTFIASLRDEVFDTADEWTREERIETLAKLDQWEQSVNGVSL